MTFLTAGGGGFGDPRERAPEAIADDLAQGFVSKQVAASLYHYAPASGRT